MSLKIRIKIRQVCLKSTEEVIQLVEQLINLTDPRNKFDENIFAIRDTVVEKTKRAEDLKF